jgi:hypothetical protein
MFNKPVKYENGLDESIEYIDTVQRRGIKKGVCDRPSQTHRHTDTHTYGTHLGQEQERRVPLVVRIKIARIKVVLQGKV